MPFKVKRYSTVRGLYDDPAVNTAEHPVGEDCVGTDESYLSFPGVSSCLLCVCTLDGGALLGMHLTRATGAADLSHLAGGWSALRAGREIKACYVAGPVRQWQGSSFRIATKDRTVIRTVTSAVGWRDSAPVTVIDQERVQGDPVSYYRVVRKDAIAAFLIRNGAGGPSEFRPVDADALMTV